MTVKDIKKTILQLSPAKRIRIVVNILNSLRKPDPKIKRTLVVESQKRIGPR